MSKFNCVILFLTLIVILNSNSVYCSSCEKHVYEGNIKVICNITKINDYSSVFNPIEVQIELIFLKINYNYNITSVNRKAFSEKTKKLLDLEISNSNISIIEEKTFQNLVELKKLVMMNNKIQTIERNVFPENLRDLNMEGNLLKSIPVESLVMVKSLSILNLKRNMIVNISSGDFNENIRKSLTEINLSHNEISTIPKGMFRNLSLLNHISLEYNRIEFIEEEAFPEIFEFLKLSGNRLRNVPTESLKSTNYLLSLDLSNNLIKKIEDDDFLSLGKYIRFLYFKDNQISFIGLKSMAIMKHLWILDLRNNYIRGIKADVFQSWFFSRSVFQLKISGNPLQCHRDLLWLKMYALNYYDEIDVYENTTKCWSKIDQKMYRVIDAPMIESYEFATSASYSLPVQKI